MGQTPKKFEPKNRRRFIMQRIEQQLQSRQLLLAVDDSSFLCRPGRNRNLRLL